MTCGIYIMYWNIDNPYIGQATDITIRRYKHLSDIRSKHHYNYKIRNEYLKYDTDPTFETLLECRSDELDLNEYYLIEEFDSITNGLNILSGGTSVGKGTNNSRSKYSEEQLIKVFNLLTDPSLGFNDISETTGVNRSTVSQIARGAQHIWLREKFPEVFQIIKTTYDTRSSIIRTAQYQNITYPIVESPQGEIVTITTNVTDFCKVHNLQDTNMYKLFKGKIKQHKGWKLYNPLNSLLIN